MQVQSSQTITQYTKANQQNSNENNDNIFESLLIKEVDFEDIQLSIPLNAVRNSTKTMSNAQFDNLLSKLDMEDLNFEEKQLYKSIIENGYISNDEIKDLDYKQIKTLGQFVFKEDEYGNLIEETLINCDIKSGSLLSTTVISENDYFNEALFNMVDTMDSDQEIMMFLSNITGSCHPNKIIAFPELQTINYAGIDIAQMLEDRLETYENYIQTSNSGAERALYKKLINQFTDLYNLFNELSQSDAKTLTKNDYEVNIKQMLIDDLLSLLKTGLTVTEVETIEKYIQKIKEYIEKSKDGKIDLDKLNNMIEKLETKLKEIKERITGDSSIEVEKDLQNTNQEGLSMQMKEFRSIIVSLEMIFNKIREQAANPLSSTQDQLDLREKIKHNS